MKKYLLIFALLIGAVSSWGQTKADQAQVLQRCMDIPGLQQYFPIGPDQTKEGVFIVQSTVKFPTDLEVSKFGKPATFLDEPEKVNNFQVAYFVFNTLSFSGVKADVTFDFYYPAGGKKGKISGTLKLEKSGVNWIISDTKLIKG